ncbi:MAG TPA: hypothetical protein VIQ60_04055 [Gemmatimonadaceae bacterium]
MKRAQTLVAILVALFGLTVGAVPARAQKTTLPETVTRPTRKPSGIVSQLQLALQEEKRALAGYEEAGAADDITIPHQAASNGYVLIRAAREGMFLMRDMKKLKNPNFFDPMLDLSLQKVTAAWNRSRAPVDRISSAVKRQDYIEQSRVQLSQTITMLEELLLIFP